MSLTVLNAAGGDKFLALAGLAGIMRWSPACRRSGLGELCGAGETLMNNWLWFLVIAGLWTLVQTETSPAQSACQQARLTASDADPFDSFGRAVALSGRTALIGAFWDNENGNDSGAAYVFRFDPDRSGSWIQEQKLLASDGSNDDLLGYAMAVEGDRALIGAPAHVDDEARGTGSAYILHYNGSTWVEEQELFASDGAWQDGFGASVSLSGDLAVIGVVFDDDNGGNSGSAYVFRYDAKTDTWIEEQKLLASDGAAGNFFGAAVAIGADTIVIGANGPTAGSAYVFRFDPDSSRWIEEQKLIPLDGPGHEFGVSVSVSSDAILIGARLDGSGSAYVFRLDPAGEPGSQWVQEQKLVASDGVGGDQFGRSVGIDGDTAVIGASVSDAGGPGSGAAYVFRFVEGKGWEEHQQLLPEPNAWTNFFGHSVAIDGETVVIGAHGEDQQRGAAYVFDVALNCDCPHDLDADGNVGVSDLLWLLGSWGPCPPKADCPADFDGDGDVGVKDLLTLLGAWGQCP